MMKDWKIIIQNNDLNERIGEHSNPKPISTAEIDFDNKEEAFKKFGELFREYSKKSYDWKGHSFGALKFYHGDNNEDILTYVLLHYKGEEYMNATSDESELLKKFINI